MPGRDRPVLRKGNGAYLKAKHIIESESITVFGEWKLQALNIVHTLSILEKKDLERQIISI